MKKLLVYDQTFRINRLDGLTFGPDDVLVLFPLTSLTELTELIQKNFSKRVQLVRLAPTSVLINNSAEQIRERYLRFIAELPEQVKSGGRNLKEFFALDEQASVWWFSQIAEKNTYKSESFNRLAQLDAVVQIWKREKIDEVIVATESGSLNRSIEQYGLRKGKPVTQVSGARKISFKRRFKESQKFLYAKHLFHLLYFAFWFALLCARIKFSLSRVKRKKIPPDALMLTTCYPSLDVEKAKFGIFQNKFYTCLQEALESEGKDIVWLAFYVRNNSMPLSEALKYAHRFIENGQNIFFLEEFNSVGIQIASLFSSLKFGLRFLRIRRELEAVHEFDDYEFYPILADDWYSSFCGATGYFGILFYRMFQKAFKHIPSRKCLYFWEMQSWEKALILANESVDPKRPVYAYQSATLSWMVLNYFNYPQELKMSGRYAIPQPDKLICNGTLPLNYMKDSGWDHSKLMLAEATRYSYLKEYLIHPNFQKEHVLLMACSISPDESASILRILIETCKENFNLKVIVKPHPFLPMEKLFAKLDLTEKEFPFAIKSGPIGPFLAKAKIVVVGESGVSLEAIALGCKIIVVNVPEWINMSPLRNIKSEIIKMVNTPQELKNAVQEFLEDQDNSHLHMAETIRIVDDFFNLEFDGKRPSRFLEVLDV